MAKIKKPKCRHCGGNYGKRTENVASCRQCGRAVLVIFPSERRKSELARKGKKK